MSAPDHDGLEFARVRPGSEPARWALTQYFAELAERFDEGFDADGALAEARREFAPPAGVFVVCLDGASPVGCGALRLLDEETAELKRMWVSPAYRGRGLGIALLGQLETEARRAGRGRIRLDTHQTLVEARALYRRCGYREIRAYNDNLHATHWFEKDLRPEGAPPRPGPARTERETARQAGPKAAS